MFSEPCSSQYNEVPPSAIDFGLDVDVTEDAEGNHRVIITFEIRWYTSTLRKKGKISMVEKKEEAITNQPLLFSLLIPPLPAPC